MSHVKVVCGKQISGKSKWLFGVHKGKKSETIAVNDKTSYEDDIDTQIYEGFANITANEEITRIC